jgi:hypothetical protein
MKNIQISIKIIKRIMAVPFYLCIGAMSYLFSAICGLSFLFNKKKKVG